MRLDNSINNRKPEWLKIKLQTSQVYKDTSEIIKTNNLHTVCEEARCPNIYECWNRKTATIMILGDICTRACGFCSVKTGKPIWQDIDEPMRTAIAVKKMDLRHVVITSVDRDDLKDDYGAQIWSDTIKLIREVNPDCSIEVLTPDFKGFLPALNKVFFAKPNIFSHNIETVERISKNVRSQANWQRSKMVLEKSVEFGLTTKTGLMVGLGEKDFEVIEVMKEISELGVEIFNIGQYLQPTNKHLRVDRYVHPDQFEKYLEEGYKMGFKIIESAPLVRSSYHADKQARLFNQG